MVTTGEETEEQEGGLYNLFAIGAKAAPTKHRGGQRKREKPKLHGGHSSCSHCYSGINFTGDILLVRYHSNLVIPVCLVSQVRKCQ